MPFGPRKPWRPILSTLLTRPGALTAYRIASDLTAKAAFLLLTMLAARRLSRDDFGIFALGSALGWLTGVVSDGGLQMHVARMVARSPAASSGWILRRWLTWRVTTAGLALTLTIGGAAALRLDPRVAVPLVLLVATWLFSALTEFQFHLFRGLARTDLESTITATSRIATLIAGGMVLAFRPDLVALAIVLLIIAGVTFLISTRLALELTSGRMAPLPMRRDWRWREFVDDVVPIGAGLVLSALYFRIDVLLLERWQGPSAVGSYSAVFRLIEALRLFPAAALAVALPALSQATTLQPMRRLATRWTAGAVAMSAVLWIAAEWLVLVAYGPGFGDAVPTFRVLVLAFPLMTLNYVLTTQLVVWDRHRVFAVLCGSALIVNVAVNARLIPALSATGAAWATLWTEVFLTAGCACAFAGTRERLSNLSGATSS